MGEDFLNVHLSRSIFLPVLVHRFYLGPKFRSAALIAKSVATEKHQLPQVASHDLKELLVMFMRINAANMAIGRNLKNPTDIKHMTIL